MTTLPTADHALSDSEIERDFGALIREACEGIAQDVEVVIAMAEACAALEASGELDRVRRNREVFRLRYDEGLTYSAIAERMNVHAATVQRTLRDWDGIFDGDYEPRVPYTPRPRRTPKQVADRSAEIVRLRKEGLTFRAISQRMGVPVMTCHGIVKRASP
jgi:DNA-directed RNA polymerase specialized sigma24 family protein